jgi:hypothetical protein
LASFKFRREFWSIEYALHSDAIFYHFNAPLIVEARNSDGIRELISARIPDDMQGRPSPHANGSPPPKL